MTKVAMIEKKCIGCNTLLRLLPCRTVRKYCSLKCLGQVQRVSRKGKGNPNWRGDKVKYRALHKWVERSKGKPKLCTKCGTERAKKYEWANVSKKYKRDLSDWVRLCCKCHQFFDNYPAQRANIIKYSHSEQ